MVGDIALEIICGTFLFSFGSVDPRPFFFSFRDRNQHASALARLLACLLDRSLARSLAPARYSAGVADAAFKAIQAKRGL